MTLNLADELTEWKMLVPEKGLQPSVTVDDGFVEVIVKAFISNVVLQECTVVRSKRVGQLNEKSKSCHRAPESHMTHPHKAYCVLVCDEGALCCRTRVIFGAGQPGDEFRKSLPFTVQHS